ncbi:MAG TPA: NlpC/P60 family protein [Mycobacteriales bacterium]
MHAVRSHRRPTQKKTRIGWALGTLIGVLGAGAVVAPTAFAATATQSTLGPTRTLSSGQSTTITGSLTSGNSPVAAVHVELQASTGHGWTKATGGKTRSNGKIHFGIRPKQSTYYRMVFQGSGVKSASASGRLYVRVISNTGTAVVKTAAALAGAPYRYGAAGPRAFDCSGFTQYVFKKHGKSLPHSATAQARYGKTVSKSSLKAGDLLLFGSGGRYSHAAIYAGGGQMWDASTAGKPVAKKKIWSNRYTVRRLV